MLHVVLKNALFRKGKDLVRVCERVSLSSSQGRGLAKALGVGEGVVWVLSLHPQGLTLAAHPLTS